jgi:hypothetical protein
MGAQNFSPAIFRLFLLVLGVILARTKYSDSFGDVYDQPVGEYVARSPNPTKIQAMDIGPLLLLTIDNRTAHATASALWSRRWTGLAQLLILICGDIHPCPGPAGCGYVHPGPGNEQLKTLKGLKVIHLNVGRGGGLLAHFNELSMIMEDFGPDVMMLTETWLTEDTPDGSVAIDGYDMVRRDKPQNFAGAQGVAIYIKHQLSFTCRTDLEHHNLMNTAVQINLTHRKPLVLMVIYLHPSHQLRHSSTTWRRSSLDWTPIAIAP